MSHSWPGTLAVLLLCVAWQFGICSLVGECFVRFFCGFSPWKQRLPETAFLLGTAAYALTGYVVVCLVRTPKAIAPAVAVIWLVVWWFARSRTRAALPEGFLHYLEFRRTLWGKGAFVVAALLCLAIGGYRMPWLFGWAGPNGAIVGTNIFPDELRTIGIPLSLAAYGFPLRFPAALETVDVYPLGGFIFSAGQMAWFQSIPLAVLVADSMAATAFYCLSAILAAGLCVRSPIAAMLAVFSSVVSVSYNLWNLPVDRENSWFLRFFGYYKTNQLYTTVAWTPVSGLLWIMNHALGFAAALMAAVWIMTYGDRAKSREAWIPALALAMYGAATSIDLTIMSVAAGAAILGVAALRARRRELLPIWFWPGLGVLCGGVIVWALVNTPTLLNSSKLPFNAFQRTTDLWPAIGILLSTFGPYFLLLLAGAIAMRFSLRLSMYWWFPLLTGLAFCFVFVWHSIWFWRFCLAAHLLLGLLCALVMDRLPARVRAVYATAWALFLIPGLLQDRLSWEQWKTWKTPDYAEAVGWIDANTPLDARVVEYRRAKGSLVADMIFLRAGNQAGQQVSEAYHPMIGYKQYKERLSDFAAGIQANDYILTATGGAGLGPLMETCHGGVSFQNASEVVYRVTSECREALKSPDFHQAVAAFGRRVPAAAAGNAEGPGNLEDLSLQREVLADPAKMPYLRQRIEQRYWQRGAYLEAAKLVEPIAAKYPQAAEAHYSLAFSLQCGHGDLKRVLAEYNAALAAGYAEFWVRYNRGGAYLQVGDTKDARIDLLRARALFPEHEGVKQLLRSPALAGKR